MGSRRMGKLCQTQNPVGRVFRSQAIRMLTGSKKESAHLLVDY